MTGFEATDVQVTNGAVTSGSFQAGSAPNSWTFTVSPAGDGTVTVSVGANAAADAAGNGNAQSNTVSLTSDRTAPTVTINQAAGQADPTNRSPINFTVVFSEPVTGFDNSDVTLGGTAGGTKTVTVTGSGTTYNVAVSGMTDGTEIASIAANKATDAAGNSNPASTSTDNSVSYDATRPTVSISSTTTNPTNASPIPVTVTFSEGVTGFDASDLALTNGTVSDFSGSGATYTFNLRPSGQGAVTVNIGTDKAFDAAGNGNTAATQFSRTYDSVPPVVSGATLSSYSAAMGTGTVTLTARVDDTTTGGSNIRLAEYRIEDSGQWLAMTAADGGFNSPTENVTVTIPTPTTPNVYKICVRGTDVAGNASQPAPTSVTECVYLAVYDPNGGFVTGGGWINSPAGACKVNPAAPGVCSANDPGGRANFGFVSKLQKGATVPTGETEFQYQVGNLNFHSATYTSLVVSGSLAQYKGTGRINGVDGYNFTITAYDGSPDGFRIKIWKGDEASGLIYDNRAGSDDSMTQANTQPIAGGSIVVRSK